MPKLTSPTNPNQMLVSVPTPTPVQQKQPTQQPTQQPAQQAQHVQPKQASPFRRTSNASSLILPYPGAAQADNSKARASYRSILRAQQPKSMQKKSELVKRFSAEQATKAPAFYSHAEKTIQDKVPNSAHPEQIRKTLLNSGVKPEEMKWSGLDDHLAQANGPVKKEDLLAHVRANNVKVKEVVHGPDAPSDVSGMKGWERIEPSETKYNEYQLPGGRNYREVLLTLPAHTGTYQQGWKVTLGNSVLYTDSRESAEERARAFGGRVEPNIETNSMDKHTTYQSPHWNEPNILAHIRMNDRTGPNGEKLLHVEEAQSDWHQRGRDKGYKGKDLTTLPEGFKVVPTEANSGYKAYMVEDSKGNPYYHGDTPEEAIKTSLPFINAARVPDAPFKRTWHELAMKHVIDHAVRSGYHGITWTPGDQQAERYNLSKKVKRIGWLRRHDGTYDVTVTPLSRDDESIIRDSQTESQLSDLLGKDIAQKIASDKGEKSPDGSGRLGFVSGDNLRVGGSGMRGFYDKIIPEYLNKYGKKWGVKVGSIDVPRQTFSIKQNPSHRGYEITDNNGGLRGIYDDMESAQKRVSELQAKHQDTFPYFPITPKVSESVMREGQAQFAKQQKPTRFRKADNPNILAGYNELFRKAAQEHFGSPEMQSRIKSLTPEQQQRHQFALNAFMKANLSSILLRHARTEDAAHDVATKMLYGGIKGKPSFFQNYKPEVGNLLPRFATFSKGYVSHTNKARAKEKPFTDIGAKGDSVSGKPTSDLRTAEKPVKFETSTQIRKPPRGISYHQITGNSVLDYAPAKPRVGSPFVTKTPNVKIDPSVSVQDMIDTFGHVPHPHDLAAMTNGGDGLKTHIMKAGHELRSVTTHPDGPRHYLATRLFSTDGTVHNEVFEKSNDSPIRFRGGELLRAQAEALAAHGFHTIHTHAAGNPESMARLNRGEKGFIGYHVWPGLGFDGKLKPGHLEALAAHGIDLDPNEQNWIGDHLDDPKFADAWKNHVGTGIDATFDLTPGSRSWDRLRKKTKWAAETKPKETNAQR